MTTRPIITVFGATGSQGGSLVRAMAADPLCPFGIRAVTRNPDSDKARALAALGADVVAGDADKPDTLAATMDGAQGAFLITNYWEHASVEREQTQARNLAVAAKAAGVKHVVWSTLEDTRPHIQAVGAEMPTLHGTYKVPHYDSKGEVNPFFTEIGLPVTHLLTSFYWENLIHFGLGPQRGEDGGLVLPFPMGDKRLPGIAVEDIGKVAYAIFQGGEQYIGKTIAIAGEHLTGAEMAAALSEAIDEPVTYWDVGPDTYRAFDFPGADDIGNMFQFKRDCHEYYRGIRDLAATRALNPELLTFKEWLSANANRIPIPEPVES
jgi:uncharacterized protein YbjT (DUF2867 family)